MAEQDSTTTKQEQKGFHWSDPEVQEAIASFRAIRAIGDLLTAAADSVGRNRSEFHESTLAEIGVHLEDLSTKALVILGWENPKPQAEAQGGV